MADYSIRGRFVWHELMTSNTKSAADFFSRIIGWKMQTWDQDASYSMFVANGRPMAGLMRLPDDAKAMGAPPSWVSYIGTPNVDETVKQAASLGGKILKPPTDIPTIGRFAVIQDPQGATFLVITPLRAPAADPDATPVVGDFSWHELATTDWRAALTFYQRLFGWEETESMDMGPEVGTYQMFGWKGHTIGGIFNKPSHMPVPPFWLPYIKVIDAKKAAAAIAKSGGHVLNGPMQVPGGDWIAQAADLDGGMFAVHSVKRAVKNAPAKTAPVKRTAARKAAAKKPPMKKAPAKKKAAPKARVSKTSGARKTGNAKNPATRTAPARKTTAGKAKSRTGRKKGRR